MTQAGRECARKQPASSPSSRGGGSPGSAPSSRRSSLRALSAAGRSLPGARRPPCPRPQAGGPAARARRRWAGRRPSRPGCASAPAAECAPQAGRLPAGSADLSSAPHDVGIARGRRPTRGVKGPSIHGVGTGCDELQEELGPPTAFPPGVPPPGRGRAVLRGAGQCAAGGQVRARQVRAARASGAGDDAGRPLQC